MTGFFLIFLNDDTIVPNEKILFLHRYTTLHASLFSIFYFSVSHYATEASGNQSRVLNSIDRKYHF